MREPEQDVLLALERLAEMPRKEYESAIPDLGGLLDLVKVCTIARLNRLEAEKNKRMVGWQCPDCKVHTSAWVQPNGSLEIRCKGVPKNRRTGLHGDEVPICGARMVVVFDEAVDSEKEALHEVDLSALLGKQVTL